MAHPGTEPEEHGQDEHAQHDLLAVVPVEAQLPGEGVVGPGHRCDGDDHVERLDPGLDLADEVRALVGAEPLGPDVLDLPRGDEHEHRESRCRCLPGGNLHEPPADEESLEVVHLVAARVPHGAPPALALVEHDLDEGGITRKLSLHGLAVALEVGELAIDHVEQHARAVDDQHRRWTEVQSHGDQHQSHQDTQQRDHVGRDTHPRELQVEVVFAFQLNSPTVSRLSFTRAYLTVLLKKCNQKSRHSSRLPSNTS